MEKSIFCYKFTVLRKFGFFLERINLTPMRKLLVLIICFFSTLGVQAQDIQWASFVIEYSSELTPIQYSAEQVLGKPSVLPAAGESPTAWTPDRPNKPEFLKVRILDKKENIKTVKMK